MKVVYSQALIAVALASILLAVQVPVVSSAASIAVIHAGSAGDPAWRVLELNVPRSGSSLRIVADLSNVRCPMAWSFQTFEGVFPNVVEGPGATFDFALGHEGLVLHSATGQIEEGSMTHDGAGACTMSNFSIVLDALPAGVVYLTEYFAGSPGPVSAVVTASDGVTLTAESSGMGSFYLAPGDFTPGVAHAEYSTPGFWWPDATASPSNYWPGGSVASADVELGRSASVTFRHHPVFFFESLASAHAANASVTDPAGRTWFDDGTFEWEHQSFNDYGLWTTADFGAYPPGAYEFRLNSTVDAGQGESAWHAAGADMTFPGE